MANLAQELFNKSPPKSCAFGLLTSMKADLGAELQKLVLAKRLCQNIT